MKTANLSPQFCENQLIQDAEEAQLTQLIQDAAEAQLTQSIQDAAEAQLTQSIQDAAEARAEVGANIIDSDIHTRLMRLALEQARIAYGVGEVPIGAVVVRDGQVIAAAHNERESACDPTAHAEVLALRRAGAVKGSWNLYDCDLYVTIEPCAMCSGAIINSRIRTVYYGAPDTRFGCGGSLMNLITDSRFNHRAEVVSGCCENEARELMQNFFRERRLK